MIQNKKTRFFEISLMWCIIYNNADFAGEKASASANATETAMVKFSSADTSSEYHLGIPECRSKHKLHEIPFNRKNKWQVSIHELAELAIYDEAKNNDDNKNERAVVQ